VFPAQRRSRAAMLRSFSAAVLPEPTRRSSSARGSSVADAADAESAAGEAAGAAVAPDASRCGIDSVEISRIERLLWETPAEALSKIFSAQELADSGPGPGPGRAASLAARFAAKAACVTPCPSVPGMGQMDRADFSVARAA